MSIGTSFAGGLFTDVKFQHGTMPFPTITTASTDLSTNYAARGSRVETIFPDSNSEHMFGANAMDLSLRPPAARAGYDQGRALAEQLTEFWR